MTTKISILCTGNEILDGRIEDTNSRYLVAALEAAGFETSSILAVRDDESAIVDAIRFSLQRAEAVIISGGLGPTSDDLTREAVARLLDSRLVLNDEALAAMKAFYASRRRTFDSANLKQAHFPEGSIILPNPVGTAAGFRCSLRIGAVDKHALSIPGVPHEMRKMCDEQVLPFLRSTFGSPAPLQSRTLRVFGIPESKIGAIIEQDGVPPGISVSYRAHYPEVIVKFGTRTDGSVLEDFATRSENALGCDFIFSREPQASYARVVHELLETRRLTISVAESCTGGGLGEILTETPGSSSTFLGGIISYSNEAKVQLLGVPESLLLAHGAVSAETACAMADGARKEFKSSLAVSITGIAGPDGGTDAKPVGTFFVGLSSPDSTRAFHCFTAASRTLIRRFAAYTALDIIRRHVQGHELRPAGIIGAPQN